MSPEDLWIGASDSSKEGNWIWDNGGWPIYPGYANWLSGQPDNRDNEVLLCILSHLDSHGMITNAVNGMGGFAKPSHNKKI